MSYAVAQSHIRDIDGVMWGWRWSSNQPNGHTQLTYSFPTSTASYGGYTSIDGFETFNAHQQAAARKILAMYDSVCNVDFVFTTDGASGNIRMAEADAVNDGTGSVTIDTAMGNPPDPNCSPLASQGDTWFNHAWYNSPASGDFAFASGLMHEIGHALGLKHGHVSQEVQDANGTVLYTNPTLAPDHDSNEYSVMTYRYYPGGPVDSGEAIEFPSTPMQDDIFALQYLYGPNYDYNSGNTVYRWSPSTGEAFINGVGQGVPLHHKIFLTVWDGGGADTYDFSNYTTNAVIDLAPGGWSTPARAQRADLDVEHPNTHFARGCIANAQVFQGDFNGYIENATGGSGNDTISGNSVGNALTGGTGNDVLNGLGGMDWLFGGGGRDALDGGNDIDGLRGGGGNDALAGGESGDYLDGGQGADRLNGGEGDDVLVGGAGKDSLIGGVGADKFDFNAISDSRATAGKSDAITDFMTGVDKIDLSDIDADAAVAGDQHFAFIGTHAFYAPGQVRVDDSGGVTHLYANIDADMAAEMAIEFSGFRIVLAGDFVFI